jgi:hypothetical protein
MAMSTICAATTVFNLGDLVRHNSSNLSVTATKTDNDKDNHSDNHSDNHNDNDEEQQKSSSSLSDLESITYYSGCHQSSVFSEGRRRRRTMEDISRKGRRRKWHRWYVVVIF